MLEQSLLKKHLELLRRRIFRNDGKILVQLRRVTENTPALSTSALEPYTMLDSPRILCAKL